MKRRLGRNARPRLFSAPAGLVLLLSTASCTLTPAGTDIERTKLDAAGISYAHPFKSRTIPELPQQPSWRDILQRAFLANGDLEAAYFEWRAAFERIGVAAAYPNSDLSLGFNYLFSGDRMKSFDRMSFLGGFDSMENLSAIPKVLKAGQVALDEARMASEKFRALKFTLQEKVLSTWSDYILANERLKIQRENLALAEIVQHVARSRFESGAPQYESLKAELRHDQIENEVQDSIAALSALKGMLNALLGREPFAAIESPEALPEPRVVVGDDTALLLAGIGSSPEIAGAIEQSAARGHALELARLRWIPDVNPTVAFMGSVSQAIGAAIVLPTSVAEIRGRIRESDALYHASEAKLRQVRSGATAEFVATLIGMRNSERQSELLEKQIIPSAKRMFESAEQGYSANTVSLLDLIESQRTLLEGQLMLAEARATREKQLAHLEQLAGVDLETIGKTPQIVSPEEKNHG